MIEKMKWEDAYSLWQRNCYQFPEMLTASLSAETVFIQYERDGYIYGYDWLTVEEAEARKKQIIKNPIEFLYFTKPSNKGTIQTAQMLMEAKNREEIAAIWIAATAKELLERYFDNGIWKYASILEIAAWGFLKDRYQMWHHAMKKLVPEIMIPYNILDNLTCTGVDVVMELIQLNTLLIKNNYKLLLYSSLEEGESTEYSLRLDSR